MTILIGGVKEARFHFFDVVVCVLRVGKQCPGTSSVALASFITAMIEAYMLERPGFSDIVTGNGRGLTVLLHGPPRTGKTLIAECIADKQERPFYAVKCGELGTEPRELERQVKEVFGGIVAWKAILLMDEADIFLQERDVHNVERNALVSIFLWELNTSTTSCF